MTANSSFVAARRHPFERLTGLILEASEVGGEVISSI